MNKIGRTKEIPRIIVPQGAQKHIASHFGVSGETVRRALKYTYLCMLLYALKFDWR